MKLETQDTIAANLRTLRITTRLSQAEIAANVGTSRPLYTHYELGDRTQDAEVLYNLAKFMNLEMEMLFEKDPQKFFAYIANRSDDEDLMNSSVSTSSFRLIPRYADGKSLHSARKRQ